MSESSCLRVLYYPFAHPKSDASLKRAVLLFDQVWFMDLSSQRLRKGGRWAAAVLEVSQALDRIRQAAADNSRSNGKPDATACGRVLADWEKVREENGLLLEREVAVLVDPEPLVHENDRLLAAAFKADLMDNEVWRLFTAPGTPDTMKLLRRKIPPSAFKFLNSQTLFRINYGTARAKALFHKTYMRWPDLSDEKFEDSGNPFQHGSDFDDQWFRFLFHDDKLRRKLDNDDMKVEHTCIFPFTHASSLLVNQAVLLANKFELVAFCDSPLHAQLLDLKLRRIERLDQRREAQPFQSIALPVLAPLLRDSLLDQLNIEQTLQYREHLQDALRPWKASLSALLMLTRNTNMEMQSTLHRLVETEVVPLSQRAGEQAITVYERLFGPVGVSTSSGAGDPVITGHIYSGLSIPEMLAYTSAGALDTEPKKLLTSVKRETGNPKDFLCLIERSHLAPPYAAP